MWEKLQPLEGQIVGCANCGYKPQVLGLDVTIAAYAAANVTKDDECIYDQSQGEKTLREIEAEAAKDPDHDYRLMMVGGLSEVEYQRQGKDKWVLVRKGPGIA